MKILNKVTYTVSTGFGRGRVERTRDIIRPYGLTAKGAEVILRRELGCTGAPAKDAPVLVSIERIGYQP